LVGLKNNEERKPLSLFEKKALFWHDADFARKKNTMMAQLAYRYRQAAAQNASHNATIISIPSSCFVHHHIGG
jgi:hypothetical protein